MDLRPVAEIVAVGVRLERVRSRDLLAGGGQPVAVQVLCRVARSVGIRIGLRRMVREQGHEDLEAIRQPIVVGVGDPRIGSGPQLQHVGHAVAVPVGAAVVAEAVVREHVEAAIDGLREVLHRGDGLAVAPGGERLCVEPLGLVERRRVGGGAREQPDVAEHLLDGPALRAKQVRGGRDERRGVFAFVQPGLKRHREHAVVLERDVGGLAACRPVSVRITRVRVGDDSFGAGDAGEASLGIGRRSRDRIVGAEAESRTPVGRVGAGAAGDAGKQDAEDDRDDCEPERGARTHRRLLSRCLAAPGWREQTAPRPLHVERMRTRAVRPICQRPSSPRRRRARRRR